MNPTRIGTLIGLFAVVAAVGYWLVFNHPDSMPQLPIGGPIALAVLALAELYTARLTHLRLEGRPGTKPIHPIVVARVAAFGKASAIVAAALLGGYSAILAESLRLTSPLATNDERSGIAGVIALVVLTIAGLLMESVCRVKGPPPSGEQ